MTGRKCKFNDQWLYSDEGQLKWLSPVSDNIFKAYCKICRSSFDIGHGGIASVKKHAKGKKHSNLATALEDGSQMTIPFKGPENKDTNEEKVQEVKQTLNVSNKEIPSQTSNALTKYLMNEQVSKSEILWALNTIHNHASIRSAGDVSDLFKIMFPDSMIANKFQMHKDKLSYVITYGLGPYFQEELVNCIRNCDYFCFSIDESINKIAQKNQMDVIVRFWDISKNSVCTSYLTSLFLGHSRATDLLLAFTTCLKDLGLPSSKILQVETDGPNVNIKFLRDFEEHIKSERAETLLDIGTCSLHVIHGCYKTALVKSEWNINEFLRAAYYLFKDFPSRRADYSHFSGSTLFPLKLCAIRWVENSNVIKRAIEILPFLKLYVEGVEDHPPATKNFLTVSEGLKDELLLAKLHFLLSVITELESFLVFFQSDKPLLPHLYDELATLFKSLASRFLKKDTVSLKNLRDILLIDLNDTENQLPSKKVEIGFGAAAACSKVKESGRISFQRQCKIFFIDLLTKFKVKSPLCKVLVKGLSCLSPQIMQSSESIRSNRVSIALKEFVEKKHLTPIQADSAKSTYLKLCEDVVIKTKIRSYNVKQDRLDTFLMDLWENLDKDDPLLIFTKKALTMFHGNAAVERSFSINKKCLVENLEENSLIAQRCVYSALMYHGGVERIPITKQMLIAVRGASSKRKEALQQKKTKQDLEESERKSAEAELKDMKKRKLEIMQMANEEIEQLEKKIMLTEKKIKR